MKEYRHDPVNPNITSGENISFWTASTGPIKYQKLSKSIETDILIIGGGISGLTTAYRLAVAGRQVTLVDDGYIGSGETGRTTAHITYALDDRYYELERIFGKSKAMLAANSHLAALHWIDTTIRLENIKCGFRRVPGYLFLHSSDKSETLEKEYESTRRLGLFTEALPRVPGIENLPDSRGIKFPGQAQFHPLQYLRGLAEAFTKYGGRIYTETRAENITKSGAMANGYQVKANHIVVATNTPVNDRVTIHTKQWPYRTYVIAATVPRGALPFALWWDTGNVKSEWITEPYHYVRLQEFDEKNDLLIAGGEDHKVGQAGREDVPETDRFDALREWTKSKFTMVENIAFKWSGQVLEPIDSLGFIGRNPGDDNIYIITGDSGNGMTHGTIGGLLISDLIMQKRNIWEELYSPSRITLNISGDYIREAGKMVSEYADWIWRKDIRDLAELKTGQGAILSTGLKKLAVYRDKDDEVHAFQAVCPHLGGLLQWNEEEKSFDCPAHGSRFTAMGKVINGPALNDLKKLDIKEE